MESQAKCKVITNYQAVILIDAAMTLHFILIIKATEAIPSASYQNAIGVHQLLLYLGKLLR